MQGFIAQIRSHCLVLLIGLALFIIPFFWLKPGEMDLGGDSGRLYFYDPVAFIKNVSLYHIVPEGLGSAEPNTYYLPYVAFLAVLKFLFRSPTIVINTITGLKLSVGFLAMYGIVKTMLLATYNKQRTSYIFLASTLAGIFYVLAPPMIGNYDKALTSHNQVFLNPLMFYLLLKFFSENNFRYVLAAIGLSFVFAPNFALTSAPPFFAFYPLAMCYLLLYTRYVIHKTIPWKWLLVGGSLFVGVQAFHLLPQITNLFEPGSFTNTRVFDRASIMHEGVRYFTAILPLASVVKNIFMTPIVLQFFWVGIIAPAMIIIGFLLNKGNRVLILTAGFYLVVLYLYSAKITSVGVEVYKNLFYLPGFSMFRNFIGQWASVYTFFYALLLGIAGDGVLKRLKPKLAVTLVVAFTLVWVAGAWPFLKGEIVNKIHWQSNNVRMTFAMDPKYEETLGFIRSLQDDGKILMLPLTDAYYQVIAGRDGGAYLGTSTISQLTGKKDFNGYQVLGPFAEDLMKYAREENYQAFLNILSQLSIRYIFHNSDPKIYEQGFPAVPYTYMKTSFPETQNGYEEFIARLGAKRIYENGPYKIYELDESVRQPEIYVADATGKNNRAKLEIEKINPVEYAISLAAQDIQSSTLVFNNAFNRNWKLTVDGKPVPEDRHLKVNGYANAWRLTTDDLVGKNGYTMILRLDSQKYVWWGWSITFVSLVLVGLLLIRYIYYKTQ